MNSNLDIQSIIEVNNLRKSYGDSLIIEDVSFNINEGEILSILGPSGSGKTTLLKCLIGLESFNNSNNSIKIKGQKSNDYLIKNRIAFVPQRYSNYPWLNAFENIKLGMINQGKEHASFTNSSLHIPESFLFNSFAKESNAEKQNYLLNEEKDKKVMEIIEMVGLSGFEDYSIDKLSGGMQQRVAIGRAIAQNTDIIAFDEPFGALDFKIREKLQLLVKQLNKTMLFVTHDIEEALFISDNLIVLSKTPTSVTNGYKLPFRSNMNVNLKFENEFVNLRKQIQIIFSNEIDNDIIQ
jgi:ABC-type nitrate/sulfonate/bicarbonate transport system ATPase subunit